DPAHAALPSLVPEALRENLRFSDGLEAAPRLAELDQRGSQLEASLEGLLEGGLTLRQSVQDIQRLLEPVASVLQRRACRRFCSGQPEIVCRLLAQFAVEGVMGQAFHVFAEALSMEPLHSPKDAGVEHASTLLEKTTVCHLVR